MNDRVPAPKAATKLVEVRVRAVRVPMKEPHQTASGTVGESPLVLTDVVFDDGVVGHGLVFTYTPAALVPVAELIRNIAPLIVGEPLAPAEVEQKLARRFRLLGTQGLVGIALAAIDMALWDALARSYGRSLVRLLGGVAKPVPAYGAVGYDGAGRLGAGAGGGPARIHGGEGQDRIPDRRARTSPSSARCGSAVGDGVALMVDYNQCLTPAEAVQRLRVLDGEGLTWVEEPTLAHDYRRARAGRAGGRHADPVRRELVGLARPAARDRRRGVGPRDAGRDEDRRGDRVVARRVARPGPRPPRVEPPLAGEVAPHLLCVHADGALARVRGLVEPGPRGAAARREWIGRRRRCHRHRRRVERGRGS